MRQVIDYKILHGFPSIVETEVKELLTQDYQPFGKMYPIKAPGNKDIDIVIQCMVLYEPLTDRIL
jgi:hypothetical protein